MSGCFLVGYLCRVRVNRINLHRHRQLAQVAIVQNAAAGSYFKCALLLLFCALNISRVLNDLEPEQTAGDRKDPHAEEEADEPETNAFERNNLGRIPASTKRP